MSRLFTDTDPIIPMPSSTWNSLSQSYLVNHQEYNDFNGALPQGATVSVAIVGGFVQGQMVIENQTITGNGGFALISDTLFPSQFYNGEAMNGVSMGTGVVTIGGDPFFVNLSLTAGGYLQLWFGHDLSSDGTACGFATDVIPIFYPL